VNERDLFAAAVEFPDSIERAGLWERECFGDPANRARLVALLYADDRPDTLHDYPAVPPREPDWENTRTFREAGGDTTDDEEPLGFLAPATYPDSLGRIGHYEVLQMIV
jgi:hypothetical protein